MLIEAKNHGNVRTTDRTRTSYTFKVTNTWFAKSLMVTLTFTWPRTFIMLHFATHTHDVPEFSSPAFSTPAIWSHVFQSCVFQSRVFSVPQVRSVSGVCRSVSGGAVRPPDALRRRTHLSGGQFTPPLQTRQDCRACLSTAAAATQARQAATPSRPTAHTQRRCTSRRM